MFYEKVVKTPFGKYFVEIAVFRHMNRFEARIYKYPPVRKYLGVPVKRDPIMKRQYSLEEKPFLDAIEELVLEWERPIRYAKQLEKWDGVIREEKPDLSEPNQTTEIEPTEEKERTITITDYENPKKTEILRFKEDERIIPVSDFYNPDLKYIKLSGKG